MEKFKDAYKNSDTDQLRKYITRPKLLSTKKFVTYLEASFITNLEVYNILILILFNQYDLNRIISDVIEKDNVDLLENILSNDVDVELDETLIEKTVNKGRVTMAKAIYEYIHDVEKNSYGHITELLKKYKFTYNENENSIDSFILAIREEKPKHVKNIISYINPDFWDNFAIKFACEQNNLSIVKRLLSHSAVDPGADNNLPFILACDYDFCDIVNELLKHPLVGMDDIYMVYVEWFTRSNRLCVAERILRSSNNEEYIKHMCNHIVTCVEKNKDITYHNDVTYLAIKLGLIDIDVLIESNFASETVIRNYLANFKINDEYAMLPYELNLDQEQICKSAIKHNDIDQAKSIINYSISIPPYLIIRYLTTYAHMKGTKAYGYIWKNKLKQYDPTIFLMKVIFTNIIQKEIFITATDEDLFEAIFYIFEDNPLLNYERIYFYCKRHGTISEKVFLQEIIEGKFGPDNKIFRKYNH